MLNNCIHRYHVKEISELNVEISGCRYLIHRQGLLLLTGIIINDKYFTSIECQSLSKIDPLISNSQEGSVPTHDAAKYRPGRKVRR